MNVDPTKVLVGIAGRMSNRGGTPKAHYKATGTLTLGASVALADVVY